MSFCQKIKLVKLVIQCLSNLTNIDLILFKTKYNG